jgi:putative ABC transport system permease protein
MKLFQKLFHRPAIKREIDEELRFHVEQRVAENIAAGMTAEEAEREARKRFGSFQSVREECREVSGVNFFEAALQDIRFALRIFRKSPGFTAVILLTLALGIGANTAIFSVVNAVLLRSLPYRDADRIVMLWTDNPHFNLGFHELPPAPPDLIDWQEHANSFDQIVGIRPRTADLSEGGDAERVGGAQVTVNFFALLGAQPALGRAFATNECEPGQDRVAIVSYPLWQRRFGGSSNVIGSTITVNREHRLVIGVMPPGFGFPNGAEMPALYGIAPRTDVWTPFADSAEYWHNQDTRDFIAIGKLKPMVGLAQAQAEMTAIGEREAKDNAQTHAGWFIHLRPLANQITGSARPVLLALLGAVGFVLLIACVNVANLLLCRSGGRRREMAVRAAMGAGRGRLLRQLLSESVLLSLIGGILGLLLGACAVRIIVALSPANIPRLNEIGLDPRVLGFTLLVSLTAGLIFGLAPAWHAVKINLDDALRDNTRSGVGAESRRTRDFLVIAEVALASVLLAGAVLMVRSFLRLQAVNPGFRPQEVAAFDVGLFGDRYKDQAQSRQFFREARRRLMAVPGIAFAAAINNLPLGGAENLNHLSIEGVNIKPGAEEPVTENRKVTIGYFDTMGVTLLRGRDFNDQDGPGQQRVCIINQTIARDFFPGADPIGKRVKLGRATDTDPWLTIVGVAGDVRGYALEVKAKPQVYSPLDQDTQNEMTMVVRVATGTPVSAQRAIRDTVKLLDPSVPLANFRTMTSLIDNAVARPRFSALLLGLFAATALVLTAIGLYGVVAYTAAQRTREIGIRIALGASAGSVLGLVVRQGMMPALIGLVAGAGGALALTRVLANQLYEVRATDPVTFAGVAVLLVVVALAACYLPARRAAKINPMIALRYE